MIKLHVVEKSMEFRSVPGTLNEWTSGWWVVSDERAKKLIGGSILLHTGQKDPCYLGGKILSFRSDGAKRIEFRFTAGKEDKLVGYRTTEKDGKWRNEQLTVE